MKSTRWISVAVLLFALVLSSCGGAPKKESVEAAVKKIMPMAFEIVSIAAVKDIPGLYEVLIRADKQSIVLYLNSKANLVVSGSIVEVDSRKNLTIEAQKKITAK